MHILSTKISFPPVESTGEDGLLAFGGDLSPERLLEAYRNGIFPWYNEDEPICWWSPDPRFVLFPDRLHVSKSMNHLIQNDRFRFTVNKAFEKVILACSTVKRKDGNGTWINDDMIRAYTALHKLGYAFSAEAWNENELAGGLYGIKMGKIFFGESMFSMAANASKFAFIKLVRHWKEDGLKLVDCQMHTAHLESLEAEMIPREQFIKIVKENV